MSSDFSDMLDAFGTTVTVNYNAATPTTNVKVQLSNPNFKSNFQNLSDSARILRFKLTNDINKGDYLTDSEHTYIVTWQPFRDINSWKSQCQITNATLDIEKWQDAILNATTGETATPAGYVSVVNDLMVFTSRNGMGIFASGSSEVGITPQGRLMIGTQFNISTELIEIGNEFEFRSIQYKIIDLDLSQLSDLEDLGCLVLFAEKLEGGRRSN
jgi:hypothetical protein